MRSAMPFEDIANQLGVTAQTVSRRMNKARDALSKDFAKHNINVVRDREELLPHTTETCRTLFCQGDQNRVVLVLDGTYIYVNKSSNYEFQRLTYTDQKKRNFIRIMMGVASDGFIVFSLGPFPARDNDAKVIQQIAESSNAFETIGRDDILLLDRGFRDVVPYLKGKGYDVKMPSLVQKNTGTTQLSTLDANNSRLVTATRFVVETRNGHMKTIWKIFNTVWNSIHIPNLMTDFENCAGIVNKYYCTFGTNEGIAQQIGMKMLARVNVENKLWSIVKKPEIQRNLKKFEDFYDVDGLPKVTKIDLIHVALGKYQIRQAASYCQEHFKANNKHFSLFTLPLNLAHCLDPFRTVENPKEKQEKNDPVLLLGQIASRFRSKKTYDAYVLVDKKGKGEDSVLGYCCECYVGLRTVGCCSHVMTIIWYSLYIKNSTGPKPASFLDEYFTDNINDEEVEENL